MSPDKSARIPAHVAIVMDGNGRWARKRYLPRHAGHRVGVRRAREVVECCAQRGVRYLTLFAFSSENWNRPREEVGLLMELFLGALKSETAALHDNGVQLNFIGDTGKFPKELLVQMDQACELTRNNQRITLNIAVGYGGRWDILQAARSLAARAVSGTIKPESIDEKTFASMLSLHGQPDPDLFIRTAGESRISNFLLWNLAYTELHITETLWPDFDAVALDKAIADFAERHRRFGMTAEQVDSGHA